MWFGDFYVKPLYLLIAIAAIILIAVIAIVRKLIVAVIVAVILAVAVYGGNMTIVKSQAQKFAQYVDIGKNSFKDIAKLVQGSNVRLTDGVPKVRLDGTWYNFETVKDNLHKAGDRLIFERDGKKVTIQDQDLIRFFESVTK